MADRSWAPNLFSNERCISSSELQYNGGNNDKDEATYLICLQLNTINRRYIFKIIFTLQIIVLICYKMRVVENIAQN